MITLSLLLLAALAILIIVGVGAICWPILIIAAVLLAADLLLFKVIFGRKGKGD